jgi:hypothetical protein
MKTTRHAVRRLGSIVAGIVAVTMCIPALATVVQADGVDSTVANCKDVLAQWGIIDLANDGTITSNVDLSDANQVFYVNTIDQLFCIGSGSYEVDTSTNEITDTGVACNDVATTGSTVLTGLMHARYVQSNDLNFNDLTVSEATVDGELRWRPIGNNGCQFWGEYDGNSKTINNLYFNEPTLVSDDRAFEAIGFFGSTGDNSYKPTDSSRTSAVIKNVVLENVYIIGQQDVGGVVGIADANTVITNVSVSGTIGVSQLGYGDLGGFVGWTNGADGRPVTIEDSKVDVEFQVIRPDAPSNNEPWCAGGFVGYADWTHVSDSQSNLTVTEQLLNGIGGLMGCQYNGSVSRSFATGNYDTVSETFAVDDVSGLVSSLANTSVTDSYSIATITGSTNVAGLVNLAQGSSLTRTYAATVLNPLNEQTVVGGLIASQWETAENTVQSSFWDQTVSNATTSEDGGTGKTTSDLKTLSTYSDAGWDIVSSIDSSRVWGICPAINNGYPFLQALVDGGATCTQSTPTQDSGSTNSPATTPTQTPHERARNRKLMENLPASDFAKITPAQLAAMPLSSIRGISTTHATVMTQEQFKALTPTQLRVMRPSTLATLPAEWLSSLTTAQVKALLPRQIKALSAKQLQKFTTKQRLVLASVLRKAAKQSK